MSASPNESRDRLFRQVAVRAAASPVSFFLVAAAGLLLASPVAWPLGAVALAAEGAWLWWRIRDPRHAQSSSDHMVRQEWRALIARLESMTALLDPATGQTLAAIVEAQERLLGMYGAEAIVMPHTRRELTTLLRHCLSLAERRHELQSHLLSYSLQEIAAREADLCLLLERAHDPPTRRLYEQALEQKRQELRNYAELEAAVARIDAQLAVVQCTFDNVLSNVIRLQSLDAAEHPAEEEVFRELNQLTTRVAELESSIGETLTLRAGS